MHQPTDEDEELIGEESVDELEQKHGATHTKLYICFCGSDDFKILLCTECSDIHIVGLKCNSCSTIHQSMVAYSYDEMLEVRH